MSENLEKSKLENIKEVLETLDSNILPSHLIQDNKYFFYYNDKTYRVRMPSQREKSEAETYKNKLYFRLLNEGTNYTKKQLKKILKEKQEVDIDAMESAKMLLRSELETLYYELAQELSSNLDAIKNYESKIQKIKNDFQSVSVEISNLLSPSIEDQLEKSYIEYLTSVCSEKILEKDVWESVWKTLEDYQNEEAGLSDKCAEGMITLLMNIHN